MNKMKKILIQIYKSLYISVGVGQYGDGEYGAEGGAEVPRCT